MQLFYTDITRDSSSVLNEQKKKTKKNFEFLRAMRDQVPRMKNIMENDDINLDEFGLILNEGWHMKKKLSSNITSNIIDRYYNLAISSGSSGVKICGAGGGGFLLVYANNNNAIISKELKELKFDLGKKGTEIIFSSYT